MADAAEQEEHVDLARIVEEGCWLVKEDDVCLLGQGLGNHYLLSLTVTKRSYLPVGQVLYAHKGDGIANGLMVRSGETSPETGIRRPSHSDKFTGGHQTDVGFLREHHADGLRKLLGRVVGKGPPDEANCAGKWRLETGKIIPSCANQLRGHPCSLP